MKTSIGASAFAIIAAAGTLPAYAQQHTAASWYFSKAVPGQPVVNSTVFGGSGVSLYVDQNTTLWGTDLDNNGHTRSVYFPGWKHRIDGKVDRFASMLSSDPSFRTATRGGQDGGSDALDPQAVDYAVAVWVLPDPASEYPVPAGMPDSGLKAISPNIVQKGRIDEVGGFWKLSLVLTRDPGTQRLRWYPMCSFKGEGQQLDVFGSQASRYYFTDTQPAKLECVKRGGTVSLNVYESSGAATVKVFTSAKSTVGNVNFTIANNASLSVGHKPRTDDPSDIYAGILDDLVITKN